MIRVTEKVAMSGMVSFCRSSVRHTLAVDDKEKHADAESDVNNACQLSTLSYECIARWFCGEAPTSVHLGGSSKSNDVCVVYSTQGGSVGALMLAKPVGLGSNTTHLGRLEEAMLARWPQFGIGDYHRSRAPILPCRSVIDGDLCSQAEALPLWQEKPGDTWRGYFELATLHKLSLS